MATFFIYSNSQLLTVFVLIVRRPLSVNSQKAGGAAVTLPAAARFSSTVVENTCRATTDSASVTHGKSTRMKMAHESPAYESARARARSPEEGLPGDQTATQCRACCSPGVVAVGVMVAGCFCTPPRIRGRRQRSRLGSQQPRIGLLHDQWSVATEPLGNGPNTPMSMICHESMIDHERQTNRATTDSVGST